MSLQLTQSIAKADAAIRKLSEISKPPEVRRLEARIMRAATNVRRLAAKGRPKRSSGKTHMKIFVWQWKIRWAAIQLQRLGWFVIPLDRHAPPPPP